MVKLNHKNLPKIEQSFSENIVKLKGSTLIETLAATVIIVSSFSIGLLIYFNIVSSSQNLLYVQVQSAFHNVTINNYKKISKIEGVDIQTNVKPYKNAENVMEIYFIAKHNKKTIFEGKKLESIP